MRGLTSAFAERCARVASTVAAIRPLLTGRVATARAILLILLAGLTVALSATRAQAQEEEGYQGTVVVYDKARDRALSGATIEYFMLVDGDWESRGTDQRTDASGENTVVLPPGQWAIRVSSAGFTAAEQQFSVPGPDRESFWVEVYLEKAAAEALPGEVTVVDGAGRAVPEATVEIFRNGSAVGGPLSTGQNGKCTQRLRPGRYAARASKAGHETKTATFDVVAANGRWQASVRIARSAPASYQGTATIVSKETGRAIAGASLQFAAWDGSAWQPLGNAVQTDARGKHARSFAAGSYRVTITARGHQKIHFTFKAPRPGRTDIWWFQAQVPMLANGVIALVDGAGRAVSGATVQILRDGKPFGGAGKTDARGLLTRALPSGSYTFRASKAGFDAAAGNFTVDASGGSWREDVSIRRTPPATVSVTLTVVDSSNRQPLGAAPLQIFQAVEGEWQGQGVVQTNGAGAHTASLPPGQYAVAVELAGYEAAQQTFTVTSTNLSLQVELKKLVAGTLTIVDQLGRAVGEAVVEAVIDGVPNGSPSTLDASGSVTTTLPVGRYTFRISKDGYYETTKSFDVTADRSWAETVELRLRPVTVTLSIRDEDGTRIDDAVVEDERGARVSLSRTGPGRFTAEVLPGSVRWTARKDGYGDVRLSREIELRGDNSLELVFRRNLVSVTIRVVGPDGAVLVPGTINITITNTETGEEVESASALGDGPHRCSLPAGKYEVAASKPAYVRATRALEVGKEAIDDFELRLELAARDVRVLVQNENDGSALAGARVVAQGAAGTAPVEGVTAGPDAACVLSLKPGPYKVTASNAGYSERTVELVLATTGDEPLTISLTPAPALPTADQIKRRFRTMCGNGKNLQRSDFTDGGLADFGMLGWGRVRQIGWDEFRVLADANGDGKIDASEFGDVLLTMMKQQMDESPAPEPDEVEPGDARDSRHWLFARLDGGSADGTLTADDFDGSGWADLNGALGRAAGDDTPISKSDFTARMQSLKDAAAAAAGDDTEPDAVRPVDETVKALVRALDRNAPFGTVDRADFSPAGWQDLLALNIGVAGDGPVTVEQLRKLLLQEK